MSQSRVAGVAVVTGAARGIGAAAVHRLADDGWRVVAVDSCADDPAVRYPLGTKKQLVSVAEAHPGQVIDVVADVRDVDALRNAVTLAEREFGGLDAAIANAAVITGGQPLWETEPGDWDAMIDVGLHGVANLARAAIPAMLRRPEPRAGRFVAVASAAAHHGMPLLAGYNAVKHAVAGLVAGLARDLEDTGVTATAISPGSTRTDMLAESARIYGLDSVDDFARHQSIGRLLRPEEIAATIAWLCSPDAASSNGAVVRADGAFLP